ncbi:7849_t:CDS:1, partial [Paraglomus occultum]
SSVSSPSAITDPYKAFERLSISDSASQATVVNNTPITNQTGITANQQVSSPFDSMQKTQHSANPYDALYNNNSIFDVFQPASVQKTKDIVVDSGFDAFQSASTQSPQVTSPQSLDNLFDSYQSAQPPALQRTASDGIFNSFQSAPTNAIQRSTSSLSNDIFDPFQSASTTSLQKSASSSSSSSNNIFSSSQSLQTTSLQRTMSSDIFTSFQQAPESSILGNGSSTNVFNTLQSAPNLTHQQPALTSGTTNSYNTFATRQQWPYQSAQHQDIKYQNTGINFTTSSNNMNNTDPFSPFEIFQQPKTEISAGQTSNLPSISQQQTSANYQTSVNPFVSTPTNGTGMQQSTHFSGTSTAYGSHNPFPLASNSVNVNGSLNNLQHTGSKLSFDAAFEDLDPLNNNKKKGFVGSE